MTMITKRLAPVSAGAVPSMVGLAIGLMALVFFSDRSGRDDETNRAGERERSFP